MKTVVRCGFLAAILLVMANTAWADQRPYYGYSSKLPATGSRVFVFRPAWLTWAAYDEEGYLINTGRASGGSHWCPDLGGPCRTVTGKFEIYRKGTATCRSSKYPRPNGGAPMPYCMHFHKGYAIHGSNAVPNFNASHGCIRVPVADARWLNSNFMTIGTKVIVHAYDET